MYTNENFPFIQIRLKRWEYKSWLLFSNSVSCSFDGNIFLFVLSEFFEEENKEGKPLPFGAMVKHDCLLKVSLVSGRRGWGGEGGGLHSMLDIRGVCSHDWGKYFLKGAFFHLYGYHWCFMTFIRAGSQPLSVNCSAAWVLQMKRNDPSKSTMGEEKRASDGSIKRKITNTSLSPDLPTKSKWENKTTFFLVVLINSPLFATD